MAIKYTHRWFSRPTTTRWKASAFLTCWVLFLVLGSFAANSQTVNEKTIRVLPSIYCVVMLCDSRPNLLQPQSASLRLQVNDPIQVFSFTNTGGSINFCSIAPELPTGLALNAMNCDISGTPVVIKPTTLHTITAANGLGASSAELTIEVVTIANLKPNLVQPTPSSFIRNVGLPISPISFTNIGGTISSCTISPSLPLGITVTSSDCTIEGTAFSPSPSTAYTITAVNVDGSSAINITLEIVSGSG